MPASSVNAIIQLKLYQISIVPHEEHAKVAADELSPALPVVVKEKHPCDVEC